jgi:hypothetical protein
MKLPLKKNHNFDSCESTSVRTDTTMTIDHDPRKQQSQQSLSQALSLSRLRGGGPNQPGSGMPRLQPSTRMSRNEDRAYLLSTIELVLDMLSDVDDASIFVSPSSVVSASNNDEDNVQAQQQ